LRKSPTRTPAFLEANRRNAQKSTGPWTPRGKAQSCLNRLKTGERSRVYRRLWLGLLDAPPGAVEPTAGALLTREQAAHPVFAELVDLSRWAESTVARDERRLRELVAEKQKAWATSENEPQEPAGTEEAGGKFLKGQEHLTPRRKGGKAQRKQSTFTFERGRGQKKKMLEIDAGSGNVIENKRNDDILSCYLSDILGNSEPVLTEIAPLGATKITFGCCPDLNVAPPSWRLFAGWKPALHPKLGQHPPFRCDSTANVQRWRRQDASRKHDAYASRVTSTGRGLAVQFDVEAA
jgi:hypothetical protein